MGLYVIFYYIQLYALLEVTIPSSTADSLLVIITAASLPGRIIPGYIADKASSINVQAVVGLVCTFLTFCLLEIASLGGLIAYSVLYGFFSCAFMGLLAAAVATLTADHSKMDSRLGMTLGFVGLSVLVSNPIDGAILEIGTNRSGNDKDKFWKGLIVWCGALLAASAISITGARTAKGGPTVKAAI
ncbi:hypothetical protein MMC10_000884 [Thelotrema lepadinum]|nr:hypothetical protein [Thelotrema lepadinum]